MFPKNGQRWPQDWGLSKGFLVWTFRPKTRHHPSNRQFRDDWAKAEKNNPRTAEKSMDNLFSGSTRSESRARRRCKAGTFAEGPLNLIGSDQPEQRGDFWQTRDRWVILTLRNFRQQFSRNFPISAFAGRLPDLLSTLMFATRRTRAAGEASTLLEHKVNRHNRPEFKKIRGKSAQIITWDCSPPPAMVTKPPLPIEK